MVIISKETTQAFSMLKVDDVLQIKHNGKIVSAVSHLTIDMFHDQIDWKSCIIVKSMGKDVLEVEVHGEEELSLVHY